MWNERQRLLIGDKLDLLADKMVLVVGIGGVGGYAVEALVRAGVGNIIVVDKDIVDITNLNRQVIALRSNIGQNKIDVIETRIKDINPKCNVIKINDFIIKNNIDLLFRQNIDFIIDACDTLETKKEIIRECIKRDINFISSMGTGNKLDPTRLKIIDVRQTNYDPIARKIRKMIVDEKIQSKVTVVCSDELPIKNGSTKIASISFLPSVAGLYCASHVINEIIK